MYYLDYTWDLGPNGIILDEELNVDNLGWKSGDCFKLIEVNGRKIIKKIDQLEKFIITGEGNLNG